jgi:hypothetical protein
MATARTKITREPPVRSGPIRRPGREVPTASTPSVEPIATTTVVEKLVSGADDAVKGVVERGVDTAYAVIDEYMERGRAAALLQTEQSDGRNVMGTESRNSNPYWAASDLMAPWIQWGQMMRLWADGLSAFMPGGPYAVDAWANAFVARSGARPAAGRWSPRVEVRVSSERFVSAWADLSPGADASDLIYEPATRDAHQVRVDFEDCCGVVLMKVTVPKTYPKGRHKLTIQDKTDRCQRGTLWVDVLSDK